MRMRAAGGLSVEALASSWQAQLALEFERDGRRTVLAKRASDGPLVVQKPLYPEGEEVCHAIVVHPPGGIAGGDALSLEVNAAGHALLTTPGAAKWYRTAGPWARQSLDFAVAGTLEWLPRETIVFDGALGELKTDVRLGLHGRFIGWEVVCLGRAGFRKGKLRLETSIRRERELLWLERGTLEAGGKLMTSAAGLAGCRVFGTLVAAPAPVELLKECRRIAATTVLPGLVVARYLGDSTEEAFATFMRLWAVLRPAVAGREAAAPRIWST